MSFSLKQVSFMLNFTKGHSAPLKLKENIALNCSINRDLIDCLVSQVSEQLKCFHVCVQTTLTNLSIWHFQSSQLASTDTRFLRKVEKNISNFCSNCISQTCDVY